MTERDSLRRFDRSLRTLSYVHRYGLFCYRCYGRHHSNEKLYRSHVWVGDKLRERFFR